jgi:membrane protease YdiL (CAAX protease family)
MRWAPPPGTPPHEVPQPFLLAMRSRDWGWWRPLLGLLLFSVVYGLGVVLSLVLGIVGLVASSAGAPSDSQLEDLAEPAVLLLTNVATIVAIPVVWLVWAVVHGMRIGWSSSVLGRLRMRLFPLYAGVALVTLGPIICLSLLPTLLGASVVEPVASFGWLVVVVLLTTPLQSAAEEYLFRGYLSQAIAGWVGRPVAGAVVAGLITATAFSLAHLPPDLPTFLQRFAVGLAASAVVWLTGGLEAAIALHAVNNVVVFLLAGALSGGADTSLVTDREPWRDVALMCLALSAFVALVARSNRRLRPETHTAGLDLRGRGRPVPVPAG